MEYVTFSHLVTVDIGSRNQFVLSCVQDLLSHSNPYGKATAGRVVGTASKLWPENHCFTDEGARGAEDRDVNGNEK